MAGYAFGSNPPYALLRTYGERPSNRCAAEERDDLAPPHASPSKHAYAKLKAGQDSALLAGLPAMPDW